MTADRSLAVTHTRRITRSVGHMRHTHYAIRESWPAGGRIMSVLSKLTLCGQNSAGKSEPDGTPVSCPRCKTEEKKWQTSMSVWQAPSGMLHWLRSCSGSAGRARVKRITIDEQAFKAAQEKKSVCRCMPRAFRPGARAGN